MKKCPLCGQEVRDAALVCRYCHADLAKNQPESTVTLPIARKRPTRVILVVVAALIAMTLYFLFV
jgi:hypothetical protein